jgi:hypothetical protein
LLLAGAKARQPAVTNTTMLFTGATRIVGGQAQRLEIKPANKE